MYNTVLRVKEFIEESELLDKNDKIIVGISGGADSVALLDILYSLGYKCIVAHCNFHLRGQESYRDEYFVEKIASKYNMQYLVANFDTKKYIEEESISLEMAARELRYAWFEKIRKEFNADKIAVAHHQDDSIETVLINLIRGTGIRGLTGIPCINGYVVRPLLAISREDILSYLEHQNLDFVEDSTNKEDVYTRNKIRLNVIPLLKTINPAAADSISKTSHNLAQVEKIYNSYINKVKNKILANNKIDISKLLQEEEPYTVLFELLYPYGFNASTVRNIYDSINGLSGKVFYSEEYQVVKDRSFFFLTTRKKEDQISYTIGRGQTIVNKPVKLEIESVKNISEINFYNDSNVIYIDNSKIDYPLIVRKWAHGDKFVPFGMRGHKKISDFFVDNKLSIVEKENTYLLCTSSNKIIWIIGKRMDDRFKISDKTKDCLKIKLLK